MTHIGAFLANRITESNEGEEYVCLHPWYFANYVLRVCRALAGSKTAGGFLDKIAKSSWEGFDGDALTKGLAFLWTCVTWAAAYMVHYYSNGEGKEKIPESVAVASAELVATRFIWKVRAHCAQADHANLKKRFPAWDAVPSEQMSRTETRLQQLAQLIADVETSGNKSIPRVGIRHRVSQGGISGAQSETRGDDACDGGRTAGPIASWTCHTAPTTRPSLGAGLTGPLQREAV